MANKIRKFINKVGNNSMVVYTAALGVICFVGLLGIRPIVLSNTVEVSAAKKALPIYCVGRDDNKIAISFDAAWGVYRLRRNFTHCV
ncbi:MAG: hypothetical protein LUD77_00685 [Clostridiales bacterium]|nr:hypothetical protein [Clostridiales bacterium]